MTATIEVQGIATGGAGVGRLPDGRVTFVHRTAPGEEVDVRVTEDRGRWTRSELVAVRTPSPSRRTAPCPHYDRCGGCTLEHLTYEAQLQAKAGIVADVLQRIGEINVEIPPIVRSPNEFRYRNRVSMTLRRGGGGVVAGFHELDRPDRLVDVGPDCLLPEAPLAAAWGELRRAWGPAASRLPSGEELRLTLRSSEEGRITLVVDGGYAPGRPAELLEAVVPLEAIWHRPAGAAESRLLVGRDRLRDRWAGEELELSGDVFTQVNRGAAEGLESHVLERVLATDPTAVVDAYSGVGLHTRRLERAGVEATAIEAHPDAVAETRRSAPDSRVLEGTVEDRLADALPADVVILNPPRAGIHRGVAETLRRQPPDRLVYVSCDPATLARDLKRLGEAYRVTGVRCFDLFPQTAHVETVVELACAIT